MNSLIIYDSLYGNTEKIARVMGEEIRAKVVSASEVSNGDLKGLELLIVGSPTHGGRTKPSLQLFLDQIPENALKNIKIAVFDTRFLDKDLNFIMRKLIQTFGYAAPKVADLLQNRGGKLIVEPEGFIVIKKEGPLKEGEIERAKNWGKEILNVL